MIATILLTITDSVGTNIAVEYIIGTFIALIIFGYLFYSLIKPEKF